MRRDNYASIGIGAMITFIALILVSALISMSLILTLEKAFKNQSHTAEANEERGKIIIDSIFIYRFQPCWIDEIVTSDPDCSDAPVGKQRPWGHHQLLMNFHLAPGSTNIPIENANYIVRCINEGVTDLDNDGWLGGNDQREVTSPVFSSSFEGSALDPTHQRAIGAPNTAFELGFPTKQDETLRIPILEYGQSYKIKLELFDNMNNNGDNDERYGCRISEDYDTTLLITLGGGSATEFNLHFRSLEVGQLVL